MGKNIKLEHRGRKKVLLDCDVEKIRDKIEGKQGHRETSHTVTSLLKSEGKGRLENLSNKTVIRQMK